MNKYLASDVASLKIFYINRGFRDVRVSYADPLSPNDKEASVIFLIEEGPQYTIGGITSEFKTIGNSSTSFYRRTNSRINSNEEREMYFDNLI